MNDRVIIIRLEGAGEHYTGDFASIVGEYPGLESALSQADARTERLIQCLSPLEVAALEADEEHRFPFFLRPVRSLLSYWRVVTALGDPDFGSLLGSLRSAGVVAYEEPPAFPGSYDPGDYLEKEQTYLEDRPDGVNAQWAWEMGYFGGRVDLPNGNLGMGLSVADLELDWDEMHPELGGKAAHVHGDRDTSHTRHGTSVLGILFAQHGTDGLAGLAPSIEEAFLLSPYRASDESYNHADAILDGALNYLAAGDVLLIELEITGQPLERFAHNFDAIRLATALGRIVVELAGNNGVVGGKGGADLATIELSGFDGTPRTMAHDPFSDWDSGAIIVGAHNLTPDEGTEGDGWQRRVASNYGDRLDCYAQGEGVVTTSSGTSLFRTDFKDTSAASAIIAGTALLLQNIWAQAHGDTRLTARQIRALFRHAGPASLVGMPTASTPTPVYGQPGDTAEIKYVPNLAYCASRLGLVPDLHVRDYLGDNGQVPTEGILSRSPDIIVAQSDQEDFAEGSGTEEQDDLGSTVMAGEDNWVYVRARNLGSQPARGAKATVWWSEPALLITPKDWHEIGTVDFPEIPGNAADLAMTEPLLWDTVPASGHYCFIAMVDCPADPAPPIPSHDAWDEFIEFISANNSVAWRNFNVVDPPADGSFSGVFAVRGAPDERRMFGVVVHQRLPAGAVLKLRIPMALAIAARESPVIQSFQELDDRVVELVLGCLPKATLADLRLAAGSEYRVEFEVSGLPQGAGGRVRFEQVYRDRPVGQLTYAIRSRFRKDERTPPFHSTKEDEMSKMAHDHDQGGRESCELCKGLTVPPPFVPACKCILKGFNKWYDWGLQVKAQLEWQEAVLELLLAKHPDIIPPPDPGDTVDPPPKPPWD